SMSTFFLVFILVFTLVGTVMFTALGDASFKKGNKKARVHMALVANIVPLPFIFVAFTIPFRLHDDASLIEAFTNANAVIMLLLICMGFFINGANNGSWYATVVDVNLPEHRATVLATANFFDIIGRSIGPVIGALVSDTFGIEIGIMLGIFLMMPIPLFWIGVSKHFLHDMEKTRKIFENRMKQKKG
nr:hypothetical protein [Candidatus Sigynarchaeota archaeon]